MCQFRGDAESVIDAFTRKLHKVNFTPLPVAEGRAVTYGETIQILMAGLTGGRSHGWPYVDKVALALKSHDGSALRAIYPQFENSINMLSSNTAINCFDRPSPGSQKVAQDLIRTWRATAPTFAASMGWSSIGCGWWPVKDVRAPGNLPYSAAPPILLVGGTNDPNTPLAWTYAMQEKLHGSRVLVWDGDGHGASVMGDACVNDTLTRYFVKGKLPADGKRCTAA